MCPLRFLDSNRHIEIPKFLNTSPYHLLVMYTRCRERKVQKNFPKVSNGLKNEGIFKEIWLVLGNLKNHENWKKGHNLAIFNRNGSRFCTPVESSKNEKLSFFDPKNSMPNQTPGSHFVFWQKTVFSTSETPGLVLEYFSGTKMV